MIVTKLNVVSIFSEYDKVKAIDVNLLFNYIWSVSQMNQGEAWTPVCLPGCSEEFMLHVYTCFKGDNLGMVLVCTDHDPDYFLECNEFRVSVFEYLNKNKQWSPKQPMIYDLINTSTIQMHEIVDLKEVQCALLANNKSQQYTQFNFPLVAKTNHRYQSYLRIFESMKVNYLEYINRIAEEKKMSIEDTVRMLALHRCLNASGKKASTPYEVVAM
jgi:hypothetical protein